MATITADMVKELREKTGAGMMDCKKALTEAGGDMEQALDELRKRGAAIALKKGARKTKEGLIFSKVDGKVGVLLELGCETDFVARNEAFKAIGNALAEIVYKGGPVVEAGDMAAFLQTAVPQFDGKPVEEVLREAIAKLGENMAVARFVRVDADKEAGGKGYVAGYIHPPGKLGVLVVLSAGNAATLEAEPFTELGRDLAMQVAAAAPLSICRGDVAADVCERERGIYLDQTKMEGKPEKMWDKIVEGKMNKFFKQCCLEEQEFVKDPDQTIAKLIESVGKKVGDSLKLVAFHRLEVGGGEAAEPEGEE